MMDNTAFLVRKLHHILHLSYIDARNLALGQHHQQLYDLADYFELIPPLLNDLDETGLGRIRELLGGYQAKYPTAVKNYVSVLDMTEADFHDLTKPWGERGLEQGSTEAA
jgi:hypothetical protein